MGSTNTGLAVNLANFRLLIEQFIAYGSDYNPAHPSLTIPGLQSKEASALAAHDLAKAIKGPWKDTTNIREKEFGGLKTLSARIVAAMVGLRMDKKTIDDARTLHRKIVGAKAPGSKKTDETEEEEVTDETPVILLDGTANEPVTDTGEDDGDEDPDTIASRQLGYDNLQDNFNSMIILLSGFPAYAPNEADLTLTALQAKLAAMSAANNAVKKELSKYITALIDRNTVLYGKETGMVDTALAAKEYMMSVYGASHPRFKKVDGIHFRNIR